MTIGETMGVFTANQIGKMRYASNFRRTFAGAESNVAIALANLNIGVSWISQLGDDELGHAIYSFMKGHGVDVSNVSFTDQAATGLMLKERRDAAHTNVYYYRKDSAFSFIPLENINEQVFQQAKILHITGITPLLSTNAYKACLRCIDLAKENGMQVVFDPNIRRKLLQHEQQKQWLKDIACQCDFFLPNMQEVRYLYDIQSEDAEEVLAELHSLLTAAIILKNGNDGTYYKTAEDKGMVPIFQVEEVDAIGAGDAFAAGVIYGILNKEHLSQAIKLGNAMGAFAVMAEGDIENLPSVKELHDFITANKSSDNVFR